MPILRFIWAATILLAAGCDTPDSPLPLVGTLERDRLELVAEANEPIMTIVVREGDPLVADQLILQLDPTLAATRVAEARANRDQAAARLAELVRGPRAERIADARARRDGAVENLAATDRERERVRRLVEQRLLPPSQLDAALSAAALALAERRRAEAVLTELLAGTTIEELDQAEAALAGAEAMLTARQVSALRLDVRAPRAGRLDALPFEAGERPPTGAVVAVMLADTAPFARVYVPQPIRARVTPGLPATVHVDGIDQAFAGRVRFVSAEAAYTPYYALTQRDRSRLSYLAEIELTDARAQDLPVGMPVEVDLPELR